MISLCQDVTLLHTEDMGPYIWSKLHKSIKMADSLTAFKESSQGPRPIKCYVEK